MLRKKPIAEGLEEKGLALNIHFQDNKLIVLPGFLMLTLALATLLPCFQQFLNSCQLVGKSLSLFVE
jgi:hypothetical protein